MSYDAQGRLSEIVIDTYTNGVKSQSVTQQYLYDSSGIKIRQIEKIDANTDGVIDGESITNYLIDALNHTGYAQVLEESRFENGQLVKITTYTIGHDVLSQFDAVNGYLALLADGHGSTRAVADINGAIKQQYSYDAYGNAHGFHAKDALTNLLYSGEQFNAVSGLQYLRARWYSPQSGRFNRLDPFSGNQQSPLSFHKYAYAHMNPVMGADPSGNMVTLVDTLISMAVRGAIGAVLAAPIAGLANGAMNLIYGKSFFDDVNKAMMIGGGVGFVLGAIPILIPIVTAMGAVSSGFFLLGVCNNQNLKNHPNRKQKIYLATALFVFSLFFAVIGGSSKIISIGGGKPKGAIPNAELKSQIASVVKGMLKKKV